MNCRIFLSTSMGLVSLSSWSKNIMRETYSLELLLGMGKLPLYSNLSPLAIEAGKAFNKMQIHAKKEGIILEIVSGYRSYDRQKSIWNRKYKSNEASGLSPKKNIHKIIEYSTLPGTSRHHWGTDVDIIDGATPKEGDALVSKTVHGTGK